MKIRSKSPHVSSKLSDPSSSGLPSNLHPGESMKNNDDDTKTKEKQNAGELPTGQPDVNDWISGGPIGSKTTVLVFRPCVLAIKSAIDSPTKEVTTTTATTILLNKAKIMAEKLLADPNSKIRRNLMQEVIEEFGSSEKIESKAYVVRHDSGMGLAQNVVEEEQGHEVSDKSRRIEDVLTDLKKITLKRHLDIENTTANIMSPSAESPAASTKPDSPKPFYITKAAKDKATKSKQKCKAKRNGERKEESSEMFCLPLTPPLDAEDSEQLLIKQVDNVPVLDSSCMPARALHITYKLVNTETKLLHRLLQAHGLVEVHPDSKDFNLLWSGLHPKPDLLRSLTPYQRVNHFPRSYELTRKDKLFKNIEKMQYFRGLKHFDFIPTTFLMPAEYKELCTMHNKTKGPWIVKPAASSRGRGIYIVQTPEQIPKGENVVVAKYIDKPLLIGGHKCDLRLYVCVTCIDPLLIYLYEEGLVRFATVKYDKTNKNLWNPCMHLCNYSINKYHTDYIKCDDPNAGNIGHKWTLSALLRHLRKQGRDTNALMTSIEDMVVKSVLSSAQTITAAARAFVPNFFNCFELFGYDILIDDTLKPWLLEINLSPSLQCDSPLDARVKTALIADTLTLVGLPAVSSPAPDPQVQHSLRMRIGACRRVHSVENVLVRGKAGAVASPASLPLTGEEARVVRAVKAQFARRGGYVRIFPSQDSWQKYSQYLDPVSGVPICSTSLNAHAPYTILQHNYNLLVHSHVLPQFQNANVTTVCEISRLKRYETVRAMPAITLSDPATQPAAPQPDTRRAKDMVKNLLANGMRLTTGEVRRAFGLYLSAVMKRVAGSLAADPVAEHSSLLLRFLKRAAGTLRMPYNVKHQRDIFISQITNDVTSTMKNLSAKINDKDKGAVIAKLVSDFLYMYYRETDLYTDSEDKQGCVSNIQFAQFLYSASEADLEEMLLLVLRKENFSVPFLGDPRTPLCVDLPPSKLAEPPARHTLLKYLANLSPQTTRKYKPCEIPLQTTEKKISLHNLADHTTFGNSGVLKNSMKQEKTLDQSLKYARS